jgi:hypothetical protein
MLRLPMNRRISTSQVLVQLPMADVKLLDRLLFPNQKILKAAKNVLTRSPPEWQTLHSTIMIPSALSRTCNSITTRR